MREREIEREELGRRECGEHTPSYGDLYSGSLGLSIVEMDQHLESIMLALLKIF